MSMTNKEKAEVRARFYNAIEEVLGIEGAVEPVSDGLLITLPNEGGYVQVAVTVKDEKFSYQKAKEDYAAKLARASERAEKNRLAAEEAERKAKEKAAKAAEKAVKEAE